MEYKGGHTELFMHQHHIHVHTPNCGYGFVAFCYASPNIFM